MHAEKVDFRKYIPLYQAALRGDWATADTIFTVDKDSLTAKINEFEETALHVATGAGRPSKSIDFVTKLVNKMPPEALELRDQFKWTPLHLAAWAGNKEATKVLLKKQPSLLYMRECSKLSALDMAARNAKKDTLLYLLDVTKNDPFSKLFPDDDSAAHFLILVIASGYYDIALYLVEKYPSLATTKKKENGDCGLKALARKVSAFKSGSDHQWWQRIIYAQIPVKYLYDDLGELVMKEETTSHIGGDIENAVVNNPQVSRQKYNRAQLLVEYFCTFVPCIKNIQDQKKTHLQALKLVKCFCEGFRSLNDSDAYKKSAKDALLTAANLGIHEVMEEIVESFPNLLWAKTKEKRNLFHIAVKERHANVLNLVYQMGDYQESLVQKEDLYRNNLLHLAGRLGPHKNNLISCTALRMQRELQWFEVIL
ncbi:hypothetical protein RHGRI_037978 [Rhododendron griersonianum]|uniref:Ankyrin repeat family protein n=1 Tax=Rhododendron griersonianum TaxID=479676 RepID=A0AAV6HX21_9ERIC|nr:hypothetical protein RHGRI_037978 [Rhododendron griersonianum]